MPRTPDRMPGESLEEKLALQDEGEIADNEGDVVFRAGAFSMRDSLGVFNPRSGSLDIDDILTDDITFAVLVDDVTHNVLVNS